MVAESLRLIGDRSQCSPVMLCRHIHKSVQQTMPNIENLLIVQKATAVLPAIFRQRVMSVSHLGCQGRSMHNLMPQKVHNVTNSMLQELQTASAR